MNLLIHVLTKGVINYAMREPLKSFVPREIVRIDRRTLFYVLHDKAVQSVCRGVSYVLCNCVATLLFNANDNALICQHFQRE
jgi:hypothetical protein